MTGGTNPRMPTTNRGQSTGIGAVQEKTQIHASAVALKDRALLILGASGRGKSSLALSLMAYGAELIADDRTDLARRDGALIASCPDPITGRIEAQGLGILQAVAARPCAVSAAVDLNELERDRLPPERHLTLLGVSIPLYHKVETAHFAAALLQYLKVGPARI